MLLQLFQEVLGVQHADDVVGGILPDRYAGVTALENSLDYRDRRLGTIDGHHFGAMDHDVAHRQVLQVQNTAKHVAIFLHHASLAVMKSNGAAQFVVGRKYMFGLADVGAEKPQGVLDDIFHRHNHGSENRDENPNEGRHHEGHAIGIDDGVSLGQHLTEKKHEHGHDDGRIE